LANWNSSYSQGLLTAKHRHSESALANASHVLEEARQRGEAKRVDRHIS
jgi:hypothetical protein